MPTLKEFQDAENKTAFLLQSSVDSTFYAKLKKLSEKEKEQIVKEIVADSGNDFPQLIIKLTDLCFVENEPTFIRTSNDFLAALLYEFVKQKDMEQEKNKQFVKCYKNDTYSFPGGVQYPRDYQLPKAVEDIFALIKQVASIKEQRTGNPSYTGFLGANLAIRIFNRLVQTQWIDPLLDQNTTEAKEQVIAIARTQQGITTQNDEINKYFNDRIPSVDSSIVDEYYNKKSTTYHNAIENIRTLIKQPWELGSFGFFRGGVDIVFEGQKLRVPHRVAEMAKLITAYDNNPYEAHLEATVTKVYEAIRNQAEDALANPRRGQKESTRVNYRAIVDNTYLKDSSIEVDQPDHDEKALLNK